MIKVQKSALVPYRAEQMYALVDDIRAYPEFLPWCRKAEELRRSDSEVEARLEIAHSGIHKSFTTRNQLQPGRRIEMHLVEGPFRKLYGIWRFEPLGEAGSRVSLELDFEFSSTLLKMTFGPLFNKIASTLVDAFIQRARKVYE